MRAVVTGAGGMLGRAMVAELSSRGYTTFGFARADLDVTRPEEVTEMAESFRPDVVVQCAGYTAVDAAESDEGEAFRLNAEATGIVAEACQRYGATFVYPSTDYVFSGDSRRPWHPGDTLAPANAYGRSKAAGEKAALVHARSLVVRTSWLYGSGGRNFVDRIIELAHERDALDVVDDQFGSPTWTGPLARTIGDLIQAGATGIFHAAGGGEPVSWFGFAREILKLSAIRTPVRPVATHEFPRAAARPEFSVLDCAETEALIGRKLPTWQEMLGGYLSRDISESVAGRAVVSRLY